MRILHLSDLHFGSEKSKIDRLDRESVLEKLKESLIEKTKEEGINVDYIIISGDLANTGKKDEYNQKVAPFLKELTTQLNIPIEKLVLCPGNHDRWIDNTYFDLIRKYEQSIGDDAEVIQQNKKKIESYAKKHRETISTQLKDEQYNTPISYFKAYNSFCKSIGIKPLKANLEDDNYTCGYFIDEISNVAFIIFNSAFLSLSGQEDYRNLEIMSSIVDTIFNELKKDPAFHKDSTLTISILHHSDNWLTWKEVYGHDHEYLGYKTIIHNSNLILSGHEHGSIKEPDLIANRCQRIIGGSTYSNPNPGYRFYINNYSILDINRDRTNFKRQVVQFNSSEDLEWNFREDKEKRIFPLKLEILNSNEIEKLKRENAEFHINVKKLENRLKILENEFTNKVNKKKLQKPSIFSSLNVPNSLSDVIIDFVKADLKKRGFIPDTAPNAVSGVFEINSKSVFFELLKISDYFNTKGKLIKPKIVSLQKVISNDQQLDNDGYIIIIPYLEGDESASDEINYKLIRSEIKNSPKVVFLNPYRLLITF